MIKFFKNFRKDEDGAVTVDWVVLTAAVVALGGVAYNGISSGASGLAGNVDAAMSGTSVTLGSEGGLGSSAGDG
ncbi:MAG: Flp family type IVb pilin [Paracoccaceae bacterium]